MTRWTKLKRWKRDAYESVIVTARRHGEGGRTLVGEAYWKPDDNPKKPGIWCWANTSPGDPTFEAIQERFDITHVMKMPEAAE